MHIRKKHLWETSPLWIVFCTRRALERTTPCITNLDRVGLLLRDPLDSRLYDAMSLSNLLLLIRPTERCYEAGL